MDVYKRIERQLNLFKDACIRDDAVNAEIALRNISLWIEKYKKNFQQRQTLNPEGRMKPLVIYHRADFDGIFCREIARKFFGEKAEYLGWDYGDPVPKIPGDQEVFMLDISIDALMSHTKLTWIDHHKTAIEKHDPFNSKIHGFRIDGVAACRLAWQWFFSDRGPSNPHLHPADYSLPAKQEFINRIVAEPLAVRLVGEYDIWDKRDPEAELFQHGLRSLELTESVWGGLFAADEGTQTAWVGKLLLNGTALQYAKANENKDIIEAFGWTIQFEGFCLLTCNAARYNSHLFKAGLKEEHDGCLGFNWDGQRKEWRVSLYTDKPGVDLSTVAVKFGGGGHKGACGFRAKTLPFLQ